MVLNGYGYNYDDAFVVRETNKAGVIGFALSLIGIAIPGLILCVIGSKRTVNQNISLIGMVIAIFLLLVQGALIASYIIWQFDPFGFFSLFK